jgi:hypothetical protein
MPSLPAKWEYFLITVPANNPYPELERMDREGWEVVSIAPACEPATLLLVTGRRADREAASSG